MAVKKRKHAYHHGDLRRALLDGARTVLHNVGYRELSLRDVARRAGVSHAAAYHHFKDKLQLLSTIAGEGFELLCKRMLEEAAQAGDDAIDRLVALGVGYVRMSAEDPAAYELMFSGPIEHHGIEAVEPGTRAFMILVEHVMAARKLAGLTNDDEAELMRFVLLHWDLVHGMAQLGPRHKMVDPSFDPVAQARFASATLRLLYGRAAG